MKTKGPSKVQAWFAQGPYTAQAERKRPGRLMGTL